MPLARLSPPDPASLTTAINDLCRDFDKIDDHHALTDATSDRREQFADAVGNHPKAAVLDVALRDGKTGRALELAREILAEIPSPAHAIPTPAS